MSKKTYEITINEGSAPNKKIVFDCDYDCTEEMNNSQVITSAVANSVIQTKDVRWIQDIKDVTNTSDNLTD
ncbi:hypothetical protein [Oceanirhabdus sp. W0125-5]|uniref:hypothetical protein n=1 Tax=Oceanirhabdus sp. W0125-5 TaxID=2999116 RepID=UPI0022F2C291|nr:hypothetical protein [Oceanirhabdus sp. W0125-5]WBW98170.1 hypothetical protein OW730_05230 [Oceanirhabdus sp. W0125-5]